MVLPKAAFMNTRYEKFLLFHYFCSTSHISKKFGSFTSFFLRGWALRVVFVIMAWFYIEKELSYCSGYVSKENLSSWFVVVWLKYWATQFWNFLEANR